MKHSFCEGLQKDFVHLRCAAGGFWWSAVESQTRAANLLAASPLFLVRSRGFATRFCGSTAGDQTSTIQASPSWRNNCDS